MNKQIEEMAKLQDRLIKRSCTEYNLTTSMLLTEASRAIGELIACGSQQSEGEWVKQKPDPEAMKIFHEMGLGKSMSINSIYWTCSVCGNWGTPYHKYCSSCGAKMEGDAG